MRTVENESLKLSVFLCLCFCFFCEIPFKLSEFSKHRRDKPDEVKDLWSAIFLAYYESDGVISLDLSRAFWWM